MRPRLLHIDECEAVGAYKKNTKRKLMQCEPEVWWHMPV